jgi:hypothetical protein
VTGRDAQPLLDDETVERLLTRGAGSTDPDLHQALALVRTLGDGPAPPPSTALADLLDRGFERTVVPFQRPARGRRWAARSGATLVAAAASIVVAGTAAALPPGLQNTVADVVSALTPFELPRPTSDDEKPAPRPSGVPTPSAPTTSGPAARTTSAGLPGTEQTDGASTSERADRERQQTAEESQTATGEPRQPTEAPAQTTATAPEQPTGPVEQEPPRPARP